MNFKNKLKSLICCIPIFLGSSNLISAMISSPKTLPTIQNIESFKHNDYLVVNFDSITTELICCKCKLKLNGQCVLYDIGNEIKDIDIINNIKYNNIFCNSCVKKETERCLKKIIKSLEKNGKPKAKFSSIQSREDFPSEYILDLAQNNSKITKNSFNKIINSAQLLKDILVPNQPYHYNVAGKKLFV